MRKNIKVAEIIDKANAFIANGGDSERRASELRPGQMTRHTFSTDRVTIPRKRVAKFLEKVTSATVYHLDNYFRGEPVQDLGHMREWAVRLDGKVRVQKALHKGTIHYHSNHWVEFEYTATMPKGREQMTRGTSHFVSIGHAASYYRDYFGKDGFKTAQRKLSEGEIHLGPPPLKPSEAIVVLDDGRRYGIRERWTGKGESK